MTFERREGHKRNDQLEALLQEVNDMLAPIELRKIKTTNLSKYPVTFIMGCPRSGTTLFLQWLAASGYFSYPSNILSRFYNAPYIGAKIEMMLTKHDFNNEIYDFSATKPFKSNLGKTVGALAPNEFWYFWRRFFPFKDISFLEENELANVDYETFVLELFAIEAAFNKPLALKGMIANWNIRFLAKILEESLFICIRRDPLYNMQSLLKARLEYYGDKRAWYSFKPPEYEELRHQNPYEQIAGQVFYTNRAIEEGLKEVNTSRVLCVNYEEFCLHPKTVFDDLKAKLSYLGCVIEWSYTGPDSFPVSNVIELEGDEIKQLVKAYEKLSGEGLSENYSI